MFTTVTGVVVPVPWSTEAGMVPVALQGVDEREYAIAAAGRGPELLALSGRRITVLGRMQIGERRRILEALDYEILV
ncbi:MAG: hypothetical protein AB7D57_15130 [Desulfovibrionaceae bacterium]